MSRNTVVLLVEDSPDDVFFFERTLARVELPVTLHVVENGRIATDYLSHTGAYSDAKQFPMPDLLFIDLKMPEMNGAELLNWIRERFGDLPFRAVVLTSSDEPKDYEQALEAGAHGYFLKPISAEQLKAQIERRITDAVSSK